MVPIVKKGRGDKVGDHRGVTLMPTLYKVYAEVLAERLREEVEGKGMLRKNQAGFRKGRGTMDQIFILNYLINRQIEKKGGKLVAIFVEKGCLRLSGQGSINESNDGEGSKGRISGDGREDIYGDEEQGKGR